MNRAVLVRSSIASDHAHRSGRSQRHRNWGGPGVAAVDAEPLRQNAEDRKTERHQKRREVARVHQPFLSVGIPVGWHQGGAGQGENAAPKVAPSARRPAAVDQGQRRPASPLEVDRGLGAPPGKLGIVCAQRRCRHSSGRAFEKFESKRQGNSPANSDRHLDAPLDLRRRSTAVRPTPPPSRAGVPPARGVRR